ncbi:hypothetical protein GCM10010193_23030 [Kitasatospora atroaurantiaca]|uniref:Putative membrane protein DUF2207 n=1 Tax=Kitasatospora atroaurantiaca TaxID=285545 RepID=A0A561F169_9ACTN|nr:DUF2207 domain-containing protein [Kitasatospora atroaurantiaca]TWE21608.1 putative membrane protein DUF2207 [Kitasatospora atroaurantiaca]
MARTLAPHWTPVAPSGPLPDWATPALLTWSGAVATALWLLIYTVAMFTTRNGAVEPAPATQELGPTPESPAVVSLLGNRWRSVRHAAPAILLDLAARELIELRQPGDDPAQSTIHLTVGRAGQLAPYERRVLERVASQAGVGGAPIGAIAFRGERYAKAWNRELRKDIIAEARGRGLSRPRFDPRLTSGLGGLAFACGLLFMFATVAAKHRVDTQLAFGVMVVPMLALLALLQLSKGERSTPTGLVRAGHWSGLHAWLRAHEEFAALPPASVALWDRYLAYGTALGVTSRTSRLLGFESGDRRRVWSDYGGTWRQVRVRYPLLRPAFGASPRQLLRSSAATAGAAVGLALFAWYRSPAWVADSAPSPSQAASLLGGIWLFLLIFAVGVAGRLTIVRFVLLLLPLSAVEYASHQGWLANALDHRGPLPGETVALVLLGALTVAYLLLAALDRLRQPAVLTGEVLRVEARRSSTAAHYLALDDGISDRTTAWAVPRTMPVFGPGTTVRISVSRFTRTISSVQLVTNTSRTPANR